MQYLRWKPAVALPPRLAEAFRGATLSVRRSVPALSQRSSPRLRTSAASRVPERESLSRRRRLPLGISADAADLCDRPTDGDSAHPLAAQETLSFARPQPVSHRRAL